MKKLIHLIIIQLICLPLWAQNSSVPQGYEAITHENYDINTEFDLIDPVEGMKWTEVGEGEVRLINGEEVSGAISLLKYHTRFAKMETYGKVKLNGKEYASDQVNKIKAKDKKGNSLRYLPIGDQLVELGNFKDAFGKFAAIHLHEPLAKSEVIFLDEVSMNGQIAFVKGDSKNHGLHLNETEEEIMILQPNMGINKINLEGKKGLEVYVSFNNKFREYEQLMADLNSGKGAEGLTKGYISFNDGEKKEGRIIVSEQIVTLIGKENQFEQFTPVPSEQISSIILQSDDQKREFIPIRSRTSPEKELYEFTEIYFDDQPYSYYQSSSKEGSNIMFQRTNKDKVAAYKRDNEQYQEEYKAVNDEIQAAAMKKGVSLSDADNNDVSMKAMTTDKDFQQKAKDRYIENYNEWVIINNNTQERVIVNEKNDKETLSSLISSCATTKGLGEKGIKELSKSEKIHELVKMLNECQ